MEHSSSHLLSVILFTPLVGALLLLFIPRESQILHRLVGNLFGVLGFLVSLPLMLHFPSGSSGYEFKESANWIPSISAPRSITSCFSCSRPECSAFFSPLISFSSTFSGKSCSFPCISSSPSGEASAASTPPSNSSCTASPAPSSCCSQSWHSTSTTQKPFG